MWSSLLLPTNQHPKSTIKKKKKAHTTLRTLWASPEMCLPCVITTQSIYFDYRMNFFLFHFLAAISAFHALFTWSRHTACAKDHGLFYLKWWHHKNDFSEIMGFILFFWTTYLKIVHTQKIGSLKADLHGAFLSHATSLRHAYDTKKVAGF